MDDSVDGKEKWGLLDEVLYTWERFKFFATHNRLFQFIAGALILMLICGISFKVMTSRGKDGTPTAKAASSGDLSNPVTSSKQQNPTATPGATQAMSAQVVQAVATDTTVPVKATATNAPAKATATLAPAVSTSTVAPVKPTDKPVPPTTTTMPTATKAKPTAEKPALSYIDFRAQESQKIKSEDTVHPVLQNGHVPELSYDVPANSYWVFYVGNGIFSSADGKTEVDVTWTGGENVVAIHNPISSTVTIKLNAYPESGFSWHLYRPGMIPDTEKMAGGSVGKQVDNPMTCGLSQGCPSATVWNVELGKDATVNLANSTKITEAYNFAVAKEVAIPLSSYWSSAGSAGKVTLQEMQDQNRADVTMKAGGLMKVTVPEGKEHRLDIPVGMHIKIYDATEVLIYDSDTGGVVILSHTAPDNSTFTVMAVTDGIVVHYEYRYGFHVEDAAATITGVYSVDLAMKATATQPVVIVKYTFDGSSTTAEEVK